MLMHGSAPASGLGLVIGWRFRVYGSRFMLEGSRSSAGIVGRVFKQKPLCSFEGAMPAMDGGGDMTVMLLDGQDAHGAPDNGVDCEAKLKSGHEVGDGADRVDGGNGNDARHGDGAGVTIMTMMTNTCKGMSACSIQKLQPRVVKPQAAV